MSENKCIQCGGQINKSDRINQEYEYDEEGHLWCMACAEIESDIGEIY